MAAKRMRYLLALGVAGLLSTAANSVALPLTPHSVSYPGVTIEHAQLILSESGNPSLAFLTIYNGSAADVAVTKVSVAGYQSTMLIRRTTRFVGYEEIPLKNAPVTIPRRAELDMGRDTLYLYLEGSGGLARKVMMTVEFNNGTAQTVAAEILPPGRATVSHHHGAPERENKLADRGSTAAP
nr:copper chaperone PCu(A)C [Rhizobium sp. Khangiran2]CAD6630489.1 copper chaperone PCu(A)C [Pseudorhizobium flavum]